jgi:hypothetical protein
MSFQSACRCLIVVVGLLLTGCGSSTPPLAEVAGTVSYRGHPVPGGLIVFTPDPAKGSTGPIARSRIQPDGSFTLQTGDTPGAAAGWHRITVVSASERQAGQAGYRYSVPASLIPEKYRSADLSNLSREVRRGEKNVIHINLD